MGLQERRKSVATHGGTPLSLFRLIAVLRCQMGGGPIGLKGKA